MEMRFIAIGKNEIAIDYKVEKNKAYKFEITDISNNTIEKTFCTPEAHIELTRQEFDINLEETVEALSENLKSNLIATNFIKIGTGELNYINSADALNLQEVVSSWKKIGADTWSVTNDGKIYSYVKGGKSKPSWWGTGLINPDENARKTYEFFMEFTLAQSGQLNEGVCFNVTENADGSLNGYFFNVSMHKSCIGTSTYACRLWRFDHYTLDQSFSAGINRKLWCWWDTKYTTKSAWTPTNPPTKITVGNDSFTCLAAWTGTTTAQYHVEAKEGNILIKMDGNIVAEVTDTTYTEGTYGFWGNNCEQKDSMYLKDIKLKAANVYYLSDLLNDAEWNVQTKNIVINLNNTTETILNDEGVQDKFIDNKIHLLAVTNTTNKNTYESFIRAINNQGKWINSDNYDNYINGINSYLVNYLRINN